MPRIWVGQFIRERGWQLERRPLIAPVARMFGLSARVVEIRPRILGRIE